MAQKRKSAGGGERGEGHKRFSLRGEEERMLLLTRREKGKCTSHREEREDAGFGQKNRGYGKKKVTPHPRENRGGGVGSVFP